MPIIENGYIYIYIARAIERVSICNAIEWLNDLPGFSLKGQMDKTHAAKRVHGDEAILVVSHGHVEVQHGLPPPCGNGKIN